MPTYSYSTIISLIKTKVKGTVSDADLLNLVNEAARQVVSDVDLRSTKRKSALSPNLFTDVYDYACPSDLKNWAIVDLQQQISRNTNDEWSLVSNEEFDRTKEATNNLITVDTHDFIKKIRISKQISDRALIISPLDGITSGGTWIGFGDGSNLTTDSDNYVKGSSSINWDINSAGGTTAGITASDLTNFDFTEYVNSSVFVWAYITDITNITNFALRIGNDSSNYYLKTITSANDGTAFVDGWNLLRFDITSASIVGTLTLASFKYAAIYMTKSVAKVSETDYRFDSLIARKGEIFNLLYYSKYMWQNNSGVYLENSTAITDLLNADTDEVDLVVLKASDLAADNLDNPRSSLRYAQNYQQRLANYRRNYFSETIVKTSTYYNF